MIARQALLLRLGASALALLVTGAGVAAEQLPVVAILLSEPLDREIAAFRGKLEELGYQDRGDVRLVIRNAEGRLERLAGLAAEIVAMAPKVIVSLDSPPTRAAIDATAEIPIVMASGDPIALGFISSLARPGGNVTGTAGMTNDLAAKRLQLLTEAVPQAKQIAVLFHPDDPVNGPGIRQTETAAQHLGVDLRHFPVRTQDELTTAFDELMHWRAQALLWLPGQVGPFVQRTIDFANAQRLPTMLVQGRHVERGALISYYPERYEPYRRLAIYVDKILKGARPGDLPVEQPTKFELVINLKTAKALGLTISPWLLGTADEVIE